MRLLVVLSLLWSHVAHAEVPLPDAPAPSAPALPSPELEPESDGTNGNALLVGGVTLGIGTTALTIGAISWWGEEGFQAFRLKDTGFFGRDTYAGGADKAGHFFSNYLSVAVMTEVYERLGVSRDHAIWYAFAYTFMTANGVEVIDGFTHHRFEYGDVVMNTLGQLTGTLFEFYPSLKESFGFRIGYVPSTRFLEREKNYLTLINDYSGQNIYFDLKPSGILRSFDLNPGPARFAWLSMSYNTFDYSPRGPKSGNRRNLGMHVSVAWPAVFEALHFGKPGRIAGDVLRYIALPFSSVGLVRDFNGDQWYLSFGVANRFESPL